jgi:YegS/Rv2252/BmrU family lipid kinase
VTLGRTLSVALDGGPFAGSVEVAARVTIIVNAGSGGHGAAAPKLEAIVAAAGCSAAIRVIEGKEIARATTAAMQSGSDIVVAAGGDGTINAVASALAGSGVALGVLPLGTFNHFAKDLQIPLDLEAAARTIVTGRAVTVDVGDVNGHVFVNNSSVGVYPRLVLEREKRRQAARPKWIAHAAAAIEVLHDYRRLRVSLQGDGVQRAARTPFVFVGNNEYQLDGSEFGGRQSLSAGTLQLCMAPDMTRLGMARMVVLAFAGRLTSVEEFESQCASAFAIDASHRRLPVSLDGEVRVIDLPLTYRIRPGALRVIVPDANDRPSL